MSPNPVIVQKFGGSSLAEPDLIRNVATRICKQRSEGVDLVAVVSAMGDTTDDLIRMAHDVAGTGSPPPPRELDTLMSTGELVSATLMAIAIQSMGYDVVSLSGIQAGIRTEATHGSARISAIDPARLRRELDGGRIIIVAGFQGVTELGDVTTLGRGGSDTTAVALAAALGARQCEIYTDVDGIYTSDPRLVPRARKLAEIGYEEMLEMAMLGAKMNPRSIELAAVYKVPVLVASSFFDAPGTLIHGGEPTLEVRKAITGVPVERNIAKITVRGVMDRPGVASALFTPLADAGISVDVIVQNASAEGLTDMSFTVARGDLQRALEITRGQSAFESSEVIADPDLAKVSIVGTGMQNAPGFAARMFDALSSAGVNIELITTSEIRITCIIRAEHVETAARALHSAFQLDGSGRLTGPVPQRLTKLTTPVLSVVVPAYNEAAGIDTTITRLVDYLASCPRDWELLVVNDGSEDETAAIVLKRCEQEPRVRLIDAPHRGKGAAVRKGHVGGAGPFPIFLRRRPVHAAGAHRAILRRAGRKSPF